MKIDVLQVGPLMVNCYIVHDSGECIIIDPGGDFEKIREHVDNSGVKPVGIFNTHGHFDHILAVNKLKEYYGINFYLHKSDVFIVEESASHGAFFGIDVKGIPKVDKYVNDGEYYSFGSVSFKVLHTPGHSPGGVCYYFENEKSIFTGDTLFELSIGRTDFPYGNMDELVASIKNKILPLDDDVWVYPGHGEKTTVFKEKRYNPFLK